MAFGERMTGGHNNPNEVTCKETGDKCVVTFIGEEEVVETIFNNGHTIVDKNTHDQVSVRMFCSVIDWSDGEVRAINLPWFGAKAVSKSLREQKEGFDVTKHACIIQREGQKSWTVAWRKLSEEKLETVSKSEPVDCIELLGWEDERTEKDKATEQQEQDGSKEDFDELPF